MANGTSRSGAFSKFYRPDAVRRLDAAVAIMDSDRGDIEERALVVSAPVRYVAFDDTRWAGYFERLRERGDWFQLSYRFSTRKRNNMFRVAHGLFLGEDKKPMRGSYGAANVSFRQLYEFLCAEYNEGEYFIDRYFNEIFPGTVIGQRLFAYQEDLRNAMAVEYGTRYTAAMDRRITKEWRPDMRTREGMYLRDFDAWKVAWRRTMANADVPRFAQDVRSDIIGRLASGQLELRKRALARATLRRREDLGIVSKRVFYASGQLIRDLKIDIRLKEEEFDYAPAV